MSQARSERYPLVISLDPVDDDGNVHCTCGDVLQVKVAGPYARHVGREYYTCDREKPCKFFRWHDELTFPPTSTHPPHHPSLPPTPPSSLGPHLSPRLHRQENETDAVSLSAHGSTDAMSLWARRTPEPESPSPADASSTSTSTRSRFLTPSQSPAHSTSRPQTSMVNMMPSPITPSSKRPASRSPPGSPSPSPSRPRTQKDLQRLQQQRTPEQKAEQRARLDAMIRATLLEEAAGAQGSASAGGAGSGTGGASGLGVSGVTDAQATPERGHASLVGQAQAIVRSVAGTSPSKFKPQSASARGSVFASSAHSSTGRGAQSSVAPVRKPGAESEDEYDKMSFGFEGIDDDVFKSLEGGKGTLGFSAVGMDKTDPIESGEPSGSASSERRPAKKTKLSKSGYATPDDDDTDLKPEATSALFRPLGGLATEPSTPDKSSVQGKGKGRADMPMPLEAENSAATLVGPGPGLRLESALASAEKDEKIRRLERKTRANDRSIDAKNNAINNLNIEKKRLLAENEALKAQNTVLNMRVSLLEETNAALRARVK